MANTVISPNMSLPVPVVSVDPGPDWANNVNSCLSIIDGHNHSAGSGVQITPSGLNINSDLSFQDNNATVLRSVRFNPQSAALTNPTDIGCLYEQGVDLYYIDGSGNNVRITQSGSVTGSAGTITGLPSGTASASYSAGTFTFQSATNTPATINVGPIVLGKATAGSNTITISPNSGLASNYSLTLPASLPSSLNYMTLDNSGNISYNTSGYTGSGAVVLATTPTLTTPVFSGNPSGTIASGTYTPTYTITTGGTAFSSVSVNFASYMRIGNQVHVTGSFIAVTPASGISGVGTLSIPIATTTLVSQGFYVGYVNNAFGGAGATGSTIANGSVITGTSNTFTGTSSNSVSYQLNYTFAYTIN